MFLAALLIDAWLIHATLEAEIPTFLWLEEDPISNSLDDLDFLCFSRMVLIGLLAWVVSRLLD